MARDGVKARMQARTDAAIEKFENSLARSLLKDLLKDQRLVRDAHDVLVKASSLCKQDLELHKSNAMPLHNGVEIYHELHKSNAMPLHNSVEIYHKCIQSAINDYNADISSLSAFTPNDDRALLIAELENTLNNPRYSQDFDPYWRS
jgi:hypothetical protein